MTSDYDPDEPDTLSDEIVHWQPNNRSPSVRPGLAAGGVMAMSGLMGALALGAFALGAVAIGALAIGRISVGRARLGRVEIDDLVVRRLTVLDRR